jgi:hypothetical protein
MHPEEELQRPAHMEEELPLRRAPGMKRRRMSRVLGDSLALSSHAVEDGSSCLPSSCHLEQMCTPEDEDQLMLENDRVHWKNMNGCMLQGSARKADTANSSFSRRMSRDFLDAAETLPLDQSPAMCDNIRQGSDSACSSQREQGVSPDSHCSLPGSSEALSLVPAFALPPPELPSVHEAVGNGEHSVLHAAEHREERSPKARKLNGKPVEARVAGSGTSWQRFHSLKSAHDFTGIPTEQIKAICFELMTDQLGWEFRWPDPEQSQQLQQDSAVASSQPELPKEPAEACDIGSLARRIRAVPSACRHRLLAALPESTRCALSQHLRSTPPPSPDLSATPPPSPDLNAIMSDLPEVLRRVPQAARCKVLEGVRNLGCRHQAMLLAPDIATVARLLSEVVPVQRRALLLALPEETQHALKEHMLAKRAAEGNVDAAKADGRAGAPKTA